MRYVDEYRDGERIRSLVDAIRASATRRWTLMEVCGGQTHAIVRHGLDQLVAEAAELLHGPGCPVCVTPEPVLDHAQWLARRPGITLCTFGDMLRVPSPRGSLLQARAEGGDVRMVYSPLDAVAIARAEPQRRVVFLAVGFETTAPVVAVAALQAEALGLTNFHLLLSHVRVPPALEALMAEPDCRVQGFLAAGHVCTVEGVAAYHAVAERHRVPVVVTGFEPVDVLQGILAAVRQLEAGEARVENLYDRAVREDGNRAARERVATVFEVAEQGWRGMGELPEGGLKLRPAFAHLDAARLGEAGPVAPLPGAEECRAGAVLRGALRPVDCTAFGSRCTPEHPLGAPMVSSEGACAAYLHHRVEPA